MRQKLEEIQKQKLELWGIVPQDDEVDVILMVCDPAYESVQFLYKIDELGKSIGKTVYFVLNKMTPEAAEVIKKEIADPERILAVLQVNPEIQSSALKGGKIEIGETESDEIRKIAEILQPYNVRNLYQNKTELYICLE